MAHISGIPCSERGPFLCGDLVSSSPASCPRFPSQALPRLRPTIRAAEHIDPSHVPFSNMSFLFLGDICAEYMARDCTIHCPCLSGCMKGDRSGSNLTCPNQDEKLRQSRGVCLAGRLKNLGTCHGHPALAQLASCQFCQLDLGAIKKAMHVAESIMGVS